MYRITRTWFASEIGISDLLACAYVKPLSRIAAPRPLPRDNIQRVYGEKIELKSLKCLLTFSIIRWTLGIEIIISPLQPVILVHIARKYGRPYGLSHRHRACRHLCRHEACYVYIYYIYRKGISHTCPRRRVCSVCTYRAFIKCYSDHSPGYRDRARGPQNSSSIDKKRS